MFDPFDLPASCAPRGQTSGQHLDPSTSARSRGPRPPRAPRQLYLPHGTAGFSLLHEEGRGFQHVCPPRATVSLAPSPVPGPADKPLTSSYQLLAGAQGGCFSFFGEGNSCESYREGTAVRSNHRHGDDELGRWGVLESLGCSGGAARRVRPWLPLHKHHNDAPDSRPTGRPAPRLEPNPPCKAGLPREEAPARAGRGILHLCLVGGLSTAHQHLPHGKTKQACCSELVAPIVSRNALKSPHFQFCVSEHLRFLEYLLSIA